MTVSKVVGDLQLGDKKVTLNHLEGMFSNYYKWESPQLIRPLLLRICIWANVPIFFWGG